MPRYVAFLRAINVGGHVVRMEVLRAHFESLGFAQVETFIASGNVIFSSRAAAPAIERKIETRLLDSLGYEVATFVRTDREVAAIAGYRPFPEAEMRSAGALCVGFLASAPAPAARRLMLAMRTDIDQFHIHGREIYWKCAKRQSESRFSNAAFERATGARVTFRGLNTVHKLAQKYPPGVVAPGR